MWDYYNILRYLLHKPDKAAVKPALHVHTPPEQVDCDTHSFVKEQFSPALVSKNREVYIYNFIYIYISVYDETKEKLIPGVWILPHIKHTHFVDVYNAHLCTNTTIYGNL